MSETLRAILRFAPLVTLERVNDPAWKRPGRTLFDPGALSLLPGKTTVPLLINHDPDREIGVVRTITRFDDVDGPWLVGIADVRDRPCWLRTQDTKVSFSYRPAGTSHDVFGCEIARRGFITELSVLSPDRKPAEPLAKVQSLRPAEPEPAAVEARIVRRAITPDAEVDELRRRMEWLGPGVPLELIRENLIAELGAYRGTVGWRRPI